MRLRNFALPLLVASVFVGGAEVSSELTSAFYAVAPEATAPNTNDAVRTTIRGALPQIDTGKLKPVALTQLEAPESKAVEIPAASVARGVRQLEASGINETAELATVNEQAVRLNIPEPVPAPEGYQLFPDCRGAVDYVFAGRPDLERAHMVVERESRYVPTAISPTGARGCTQLTTNIRNAFLQGPWDDPYWSVLAMRSAVDHPDWGWCHWDVVNYCSAGGDF